MGLFMAIYVCYNLLFNHWLHGLIGLTNENLCIEDVIIWLFMAIHVYSLTQMTTNDP